MGTTSSKNTGQGGYSPRPAAPHLCREAAGGWAYSFGLQHPEGIHPPPCPASPGWPLEMVARHEAAAATRSPFRSLATHSHQGGGAGRCYATVTLLCDRA